MKYTGIAAVAAVVLMAAGAQAATSVSLTVGGNVAMVCEVTDFVAANATTLDLTNTSSAQNVGSATYKCNDPAGFSRTITSANAGLLKRTGGGAGENNIPYLFDHGGTNGLTVSPLQLTTAHLDSMSGSTAFAAGVTGNIDVTIQAPSGPLLAGAYTDTITISISPN